MPFGCEHSTRTSTNIYYSPGGNRCQEGKRKRRNALQIGWLYFFLRHLLLEIFPVEDIPFPPALGDLPGEFRDLLPDERGDVLRPRAEPLLALPEHQIGTGLRARHLPGVLLEDRLDFPVEFLLAPEIGRHLADHLPQENVDVGLRPDKALLLPRGGGGAGDA